MANWVRGSIDEALEAARKAIQLDAGSVIALYTLSRVYQATGRFAEAVQSCEQILEINPDFYNGLLGLQAGLAGLGNTEAAMAATRRLVAFFPGYLARVPDDARAHILFAVSLAEVGERAQALQEADTALALGGSDGVMLYNLACVYCSMAEPDKGVETLVQAFAAGYSNVHWVRADPDLACIRQDPRYLALIAPR
jgi:tetratricopeptide (TPR) repeat protein